MRKIYNLLALFVLLSFAVSAQDADNRYAVGKNYLNNGKFTLAMESFKPLLTESKDNKYVQYAHFYYALSAMKAGKVEDARQIVKQLTLKYPNWEKNNDADFLYTNILFESGKYKDALQCIDLMDKNVKANATVMEAYYLAKMDNVESLKWLQQSFPKDKALGKELANRLSQSTMNEKDKMLYNYLVDEFKLEKKKQASPGQRKSQYNIALLLPFMVANLPVENVNRSNQFILDLYQGLRLAVDSLNKAGLKVNVYAFDTEKEIDKFKVLLQKSDFQKMDLIIGPVYPAQIPVLAEFSEKNKIPVISPFSYAPQATVGKSKFFYFQPSYINQGAALASYVYKVNKPVATVKNNQVIVLYGTSEKDSAMAFAYKQKLASLTAGNPASDTTLKVRIFEKVNRADVARVKKILSDSLSMRRINHVVVLSSDQVIAANVISNTEIFGYEMPIYTTSDWLDFNLISIDQFERRNVHFLYPDFIDFESPNVVSFRSKYLEKTHLYPSTFAYQGFEIMMLVGKSFMDSGSFGQSLQNFKSFKGAVLAGFDFSESQANKYVPIVHFVNGDLELSNTPAQ